jgi:hypothetical protein
MIITLRKGGQHRQVAADADRRIGHLEPRRSRRDASDHIDQLSDRAVEGDPINTPGMGIGNHN